MLVPKQFRNILKINEINKRYTGINPLVAPLLAVKTDWLILALRYLLFLAMAITKIIVAVRPFPSPYGEVVMER